MKGLSAIRRQGITRGRHVLGIFLAAWMAVILQPCAVAGDVEHDCPHCPPEMVHEGHHEEAVSDTDCAIGGQIGYETRNPQPKLDDVSSHVVAFLRQVLDDIDLTLGSHHRFSSTKSHAFPSGPPLNVLNCVYLK